MNLIALPAFADNYIWMFHDGHHAVVVDPGDAIPVLAALDALTLKLHSILVTHHHADHVGGVNALRPRLQGVVYGPAHEVIPAPYVPLTGGQRISVLGLSFEVLDVPGHTAGHIAYSQIGPLTHYPQNPHNPQNPENADNPDGAERVEPAPWLFCGDTLFSAGCGRLFEGTPAQMSASLARFAALPGNTKVCCTHEYTLQNLKFAAAVEPHNTTVAQHTLHCQALRQAGLPTLPSHIALELQINPFLRCDQAAVQATARQHGAAANDPVSVLAALREWKNHYR